MNRPRQKGQKPEGRRVQDGSCRSVRLRHLYRCLVGRTGRQDRSASSQGGGGRPDGMSPARIRRVAGVVPLKAHSKTRRRCRFGQRGEHRSRRCPRRDERERQDLSIPGTGAPPTKFNRGHQPTPGPTGDGEEGPPRIFQRLAMQGGPPPPRAGPYSDVEKPCHEQAAGRARPVAQFRPEMKKANDR